MNLLIILGIFGGLKATLLVRKLVLTYHQREKRLLPLNCLWIFGCIHKLSIIREKCPISFRMQVLMLFAYLSCISLVLLLFQNISHIFILLGTLLALKTNNVNIYLCKWFQTCYLWVQLNKISTYIVLPKLEYSNFRALVPSKWFFFENYWRKFYELHANQIRECISVWWMWLVALCVINK